MMEMAETTGALTGANYQLPSPSTNQQPAFYKPDALPVTQPTVSEH